MDEMELDHIDLESLRRFTSATGEASRGRANLTVVVELNHNYVGDDEEDGYDSEVEIEREGITVNDDGSAEVEVRHHLSPDGERRYRRSTYSHVYEERYPILAGTQDGEGEPGEEQHDLSQPQAMGIKKTSDTDTSSITIYEDSDSSPSCRASHMSPDSEDGYDLVRTLRHYRRRRRRSSNSSTTDSNCSCESCVSKANKSFFDSEEGPPGGEATIYRRAALWMDSMKYLIGLGVYGTLFFSLVLTVSVLVREDVSLGAECEGTCRLLYWSVPLLLVTVVVIMVWNFFWCFLIRKGYGKGKQLVEREYVIRYAQSKGLVYSARGAIYAPTTSNPKGPKNPPLYEKVAYESECHSSTYFDSDLEADGQYRRSITPWREVADPAASDRRNIYTRRAWFRDVPIIWWEMWTQPSRDY